MALLVTAEDNDDLRKAMARSLQRAGHTVVDTADGAQALSAVQQHRPDAVITDVEMPLMTGLQMCRAIRDDPHLKHTPVLVVSGSIDPQDQAAKDAGVTAVVSKPFAPADLVHHVNDILAHPAQRHE
jgi:CheY-like chemotaxis protein